MEKLVRAPYVKTGFQGSTLYLGFGSIQQVIDDPQLQNAIMNSLQRWGTPHTRKEIQGMLEADHEPATSREAIHILTRGRYLLRACDYDRSQRYSRHHLYYTLSESPPLEAQARLGAATVALVGCGGIGNVVSSLLVAAGVGRLILLDDDMVEESNLTRQLMFTESDVGWAKTSALADRLSERNKAVSITAICDRATPATLEALGPPDLLILSAGAKGILPMVNDHCVRNDISFLHVCYVEDIAAWGPLVIPEHTGCWSCNRLVAEDDPGSPHLAAVAAQLASSYQPPSFGPINALASSMATVPAFLWVRPLAGHKASPKPTSPHQPTSHPETSSQTAFPIPPEGPGPSPLSYYCTPCPLLMIRSYRLVLVYMPHSA